MSGQAFAVAVARVAIVLYVAALAAMLSRRGAAGRRPARALWTAGCAVYLIHVWAAFEFFHRWSHAAALAHTAAVTAETVGRATGAGLWVNYAFTLVWLVDVAWWWSAPASHAARPAWVAWLVHGFLGFVVINATVVFGSPVARALGLLSSVWLIGLWWRRSRSAGRGPRFER